MRQTGMCNRGAQVWTGLQPQAPARLFLHLLTSAAFFSRTQRTLLCTREALKAQARRCNAPNHLQPATQRMMVSSKFKEGWNVYGYETG